MNRRDFLAVLGGSFLFPGLPEFHEQEMVAWWDKNDSMEPWSEGPGDDWDEYNTLLESMIEEAHKLTPEQLYEQGLREVKTPYGTLRYWKHKLFKEDDDEQT